MSLGSFVIKPNFIVLTCKLIVTELTADATLHRDRGWRVLEPVLSLSRTSRFLERPSLHFRKRLRCSVDTYWRQTRELIRTVACFGLFWDHLKLQWIILQENTADVSWRQNAHVLRDTRDNCPLTFLRQLFSMLLPRQNSVSACDLIMLRVSVSACVFVQVDIVLNKLVQVTVAGTAGCSPVQRDRWSFLRLSPHSPFCPSHLHTIHLPIIDLKHSVYCWPSSIEYASLQWERSVCITVFLLLTKLELEIVLSLCIGAPAYGFCCSNWAKPSRASSSFSLSSFACILTRIWGL